MAINSGLLCKNDVNFYLLWATYLGVSYNSFPSNVIHSKVTQLYTKGSYYSSCLCNVDKSVL